MTEIDLRRVPKDWRNILKAARKAGWAIWMTNGGHISFRGPDSDDQNFTIAGTGKMLGRTGKNYRALMRRHGVPGV
jgi:hypothetical protein